MAARAEDRAWMQRALELARRGVGRTRPNPPVGAVVVCDGKAVGAGYHARAGGWHAERLALRRAGERARGATLYVTLEPCCTQGRTPPCTGYVIESGIARVVVACRDPNPAHCGRGLRRLRAAGIEVREGVLRRDAQSLLEPFASWIERGRPWVTLKLAVSMDGRIADASGRSQWITSGEARRMVQDLRRRADGIMVGSGTIATDDPGLLPRPAHGRCPRRIVVDSAGRAPARARVFTDRLADRTWWAVAPSCSQARRRTRTRCGATVLEVPASDGHLDLGALMDELGRRGLLHVVCEGGGGLAGALLKAGLVDRCWLFTAPCWLGEHGRPGVGGVDWTLAAAPRWTLEQVCRAGPDALLIARPGQPDSPPRE